ncbi:MAG: nitrite reductase small subunit NirD [Acidimicrobiales bacterium]
MTAVPVRTDWLTVCDLTRLTPSRGVAATVGWTQVAIFLLPDGEVLAIDDLDPFSGASVLSRGLVGDVEGIPTVASPVYKQRFDLRTGRCLDDATVTVRRWAVRVHDGQIMVATG